MRDSTSRPSSFGQNSCSAWRICSEPTKRWGKCARVDHCRDALWLPLVETTEASTQSVTDRNYALLDRLARFLLEDVDRAFDVGGRIAVPSSSRTKLRQDLQIGDRRNTFDK